MSNSEFEKTFIVAFMELLSSLLGGIFSFLAGYFFTKEIYIAVALGIGGIFVSKLIIKSWLNAMISSQKNPFKAAFLFLLMAIALNVGFLLTFSSGL